MYELMVETDFSAAHQLRGYKGSCERLHGHNWKVQIFLEGEELDEIGMLVDFREVKEKANRLIEKLDHRYLNELPEFSKMTQPKGCGYRLPLPEFSKMNPTTENIARYIFRELSKEINNIKKVTVWESEKSCASYIKGGGKDE
jgi:6-pyruvoyltetrahydropterin/6-carboxytetrahydropterin synthase